MNELYPTCEKESRSGAAHLPVDDLAQPDTGGEVGSLPCLNCNNADKTRSKPLSELELLLAGLQASGVALTSYHQKAAFALERNIERFIWQVGCSKVAFLTLTFPDHVADHRKANLRFQNYVKREFPKVFGPLWLRVSERHHNGAWHFHCLVDCQQDIQTGLNFNEIYGSGGKRPKYGSASPYLRSIWQHLRESLPAYGFGRHELLPIRSTVQAMTKYLGKYLSKGNLTRPDQDKGVRLVGYSKDFVRSSPKMAWNSPASKKWRENVATFARKVGVAGLVDLTDTFGSRWAFKLRDYIDLADQLTPAQAFLLLARFKEYETAGKPLPKPRLQSLCGYSHSKNRAKPPQLAEFDSQEGVLVDHFTGEILF